MIREYQSPEELELNMAIAAELGWSNIRTGWISALVGNNPHGQLQFLPNWSGSLDAMYELEAALAKEAWEKYTRSLLIIAHNTMDENFGKSAAECLIHATAMQKAKAWLAVEGKGSLQHKGETS